MFDVGCTIKSHGVGSVVVQKRGFESLYGDRGHVKQGNKTMNFNNHACEVIDSRKSVNYLAGVSYVYQPDYMMNTLRSGYSHKPHLAKEYSAAISQAAMRHIGVLQSVRRWATNHPKQYLTITVLFM
eukprot:3608420-Ditylum_brightwellii.AAC.1